MNTNDSPKTQQNQGGSADPCLAAALQYARRGYRVFPLTTRGDRKAPAVENGVDDATTDIAQIEAWWQTRPGAGIGVRIPSNVVVVDVDPRSGGDDTLRGWCGVYGWDWLAGVPRASTGSGGDHYWLAYPGVALRKSIGGVDFVRGNKYVVVPPSVTSFGPYAWDVKLPRDIADLPPLPDWLLKLALVPEAPKTSATRTFGDRDELNDGVWSYTSWSRLLGAHGWTLVRGDGDSDGSAWRHPASDNDASATIKHGCLFVYSPNTPFRVTEDGDPHGVTLFRAYMTLEHGGDAKAARAALCRGGHLECGDDWISRLVADINQAENVEAPELALPDDLPQPLDWHKAWNEVEDEEWLVEPILLARRQHQMFADAKVGKSILILEVAAALATGRPIFDQPASTPASVLYVDLENGVREDIVPHLEAFGYRPDELGNLHYFSFPRIGPLDTEQGGRTLEKLLELYRPTLVVFDSFARVTEGDEDRSETVRAFYRHTMIPLKRLGITSIRLDNTGHENPRARGSSAKRDDVDVNLHLVKKDGTDARRNLELVCKSQRSTTFPDKTHLVRVADQNGSRHELASGRAWTEGTKAAVELLDRLGVPVGTSQRKTRDALKDAGERLSDIVMRDAIRYRKQRLPDFDDRVEPDSPRSETVDSTRFDAASDAHANALLTVSPRGAPRSAASTGDDSPRRPVLRTDAASDADLEAIAEATVGDPPGKPAVGLAPAGIVHERADRG